MNTDSGLLSPSGRRCFRYSLAVRINDFHCVDLDWVEIEPSKGRLFGVSDGGRTRDNPDHNRVLYQLSYAHQAFAARPNHTAQLIGEILEYRRSIVSKFRDRISDVRESAMIPGLHWRILVGFRIPPLR